VGGFDDFGLTRRELLWQAGLWLGPETDPERSGGREDHPQVEMELSSPYADFHFPDLGPEDRMVAEYRMLHFSSSLHPLVLLRDQLLPGTISSSRLPDLPQGATVQLAGIVVARQRPQTAKGYVFVLMEDEDGPINAIVKPKIYQRDRSTVRMEPFVTVRGRLQKDGATLNVIASSVKPLRMGSVVPEETIQDAMEEARPELPHVREWWGNPEKAKKSPFYYLTALRQAPPGVKHFG
jgi:error-prone DNA polymerase